MYKINHPPFPEPSLPFEKHCGFRCQAQRKGWGGMAFLFLFLFETSCPFLHTHHIFFQSDVVHEVLAEGTGDQKGDGDVAGMSPTAGSLNDPVEQCLALGCTILRNVHFESPCMCRRSFMQERGTFSMFPPCVCTWSVPGTKRGVAQTH